MTIAIILDIQINMDEHLVNIITSTKYYLQNSERRTQKFIQHDTCVKNVLQCYGI